MPRCLFHFLCIEANAALVLKDVLDVLNVLNKTCEENQAKFVEGLSDLPASTAQKTRLPAPDISA